MPHDNAGAGCCQDAPPLAIAATHATRGDVDLSVGAAMRARTKRQCSRNSARAVASMERTQSGARDPSGDEGMHTGGNLWPNGRS